MFVNNLMQSRASKIESGKITSICKELSEVRAQIKDEHTVIPFFANRTENNQPAHRGLKALGLMNKTDEAFILKVCRREEFYNFRQKLLIYKQ